MKKVNMQDLSDKLTVVYGDECEKNVVGIVVYENNGEYFFDKEFKHLMNNNELEALLLRGAVIEKNGMFYSPTSFNNNGVAFGGGGEAFIPTTSNSNECYCIKNAVFFGDSITHGVYSYFNSAGGRQNGFDTTDDGHPRIPAYFGEMSGANVTNNGKRGSGWVIDTRKLGNGLEMTRQTNFANYDFAAYCLGINDWIQGAPLGSLTNNANVAAASESSTETVVEQVTKPSEPMVTTLTQGYASNISDDSMLTRVKSGYLRAPYHIEVNEGYRIRAIYAYPTNDGVIDARSMTVKTTSTEATSYDITENTTAYHIITFAKADATQNISPEEDIIKELRTIPYSSYKVTGGVIEGAEPVITYLSNGAGSGSTTSGDVVLPDIVPLEGRADRLRTDFIQAPFHIEVNDGYVIRTICRYSKNDYISGLCEVITNTTTHPNLTNYTVTSVDEDFPYYMVTFTKTDSSQNISPTDDVIKSFYVAELTEDGGDSPAYTEGTVVGNMVLCFDKIAKDNPLCKVVVYSPYNTWGQVSVGGDYTSNVLYGDETTNYALGAKNKAGYTLQDLIDSIDEVCKFYGIAHVPLSQSNVCNRLTIKNIMIDGLHPSREARPFLAAEIFGKKEFDR